MTLSIKATASYGIEMLAMGTVLVFFLYGVAWRLPPFLTSLSLTQSILTNTLLPILILLWIMVSMIFFVYIFNGRKPLLDFSKKTQEVKKET